jgi:hypothetical protein
LAVVGQLSLEVLPNWQQIRGWEAYHIAESVVAGEGFSFRAEHRWLFFDSVSLAQGGFHPTAWSDPVYVYTMASLIVLLKEYHVLGGVLLNLLLLFSAFALTYRLGESLMSPMAGVMAVVMLALIERFPTEARVLNNTMLASAMVLLSAVMLLEFLKAPSNRNAGLLGAVLGLTALSHMVALYFVPITDALVAVWGWSNKPAAIRHAILVTGVAALTVLPWTTRNYVTFGELVPVRNGTGQITFMSVVGLGGAMAPHRLRSQVKPQWPAESPYQAVFNLTQTMKQHALYDFQIDYAGELGPEEFAGMNEAQRDVWLLKEATSFMRANPTLSLQLALAKLKLFVRISNTSIGTIVCLLAAAGGLLALRTPAALGLTLWTATYVGPFLIIAPFFYRYRAPIEPILALLAVFAGWKAVQIGRRFRLGDAVPSAR